MVHYLLKCESLMPEADDILAPLAVHGLVPAPGILFCINSLATKKGVRSYALLRNANFLPIHIRVSISLAVSSIYCRLMLLLFSLPWYPSVFSALCCPLLEASPASSPPACATEHRAPEAVTT